MAPRRILVLTLALGLATAARVDDDDDFSSTEADWSPVKLVINSNTNYGTPRKVLLDSMRAMRFANFSDVLIILGGSDSDRIYTDNDIVYIETPFENYDLTGLSMLSHYKNHPFVLANVYFYLLDTSTVGAGFPEKFRSLQNVGYQEYRSAQRPASNICAFGRGVLENFGANFDQPLSKLEGLDFEFGHIVKGVKQIEDFSKQVTELKPRIAHGEPVDIYQTGHPRKVYWDPDFDIFKYIFMEKYGDINGGVKSLSCCPRLRRFGQNRRHKRKRHHHHQHHHHHHHHAKRDESVLA